jgi:pyrroloquinoline-quinone synthase
LGALYAYERQTPEVSKSKIEDLKKHYSISYERSLQFFTVHMHADEWHSEECENLIADLSEEEQEKAMQGAKKEQNSCGVFLTG